MSAIEGTVVVTAAPTIADRTGGFSLYGWLFSSFFIAMSASSLIYGKLADSIGRKKTLLIGIAVLVMGSLMCGFAHSMPVLVGFRFIQGMGAGVIYPLTNTVIGDLYSVEERGYVQGMLASVWAVAALLGPLSAAIILGHLSWAWIFWINIPIGMLTALGLVLVLEETMGSRSTKIDYGGAALIAIFAACLLLRLVGTNTSLRVRAASSVLLFLIAVCFATYELHTQEPLVNVKLWSGRVMALSNLAIFFSGTAAVAVTTAMPIYVQNVLGDSPTAAGIAVSGLVLGYPISLASCGRLYRALGFSKTQRLGTLLLPVGATSMLFIDESHATSLACVGTFLMGCGIGCMTATALATIQESVEWSDRGSATAAFAFARSLGNTAGGAVISFVLSLSLSYAPQQTTLALHRLLNEPASNSNFIGNPVLTGRLEQAIHWSILLVIGLSIAACVATWFVGPPIPTTQNAPRLSR